MNLHKHDRCPIHRSFFCCGREQFRHERNSFLPVRRIEDEFHPRGYRELRSPAAMRILINQKIHEQQGLCAICGQPFDDYTDIVPDHIRPRAMGAAWRDDHPENIAAVHRRCNLRKGSKRTPLVNAAATGVLPAPCSSADRSTHRSELLINPLIPKAVTARQQKSKSKYRKEQQHVAYPKPTQNPQRNIPLLTRDG